MDTLFSKPQRSTLDRTQPWYGQYHIKVSFELPYAQVIRLQNHHQIDQQMELRREWANEMLKPGYGSWQWLTSKGEITQETVAHLHTLFDFVKSQPNSRVLSDAHYFSFYTNSEEAVDQLISFSFVNSPKIVRLNIVGEPNTLYRKRSKFLYRSYLKHRRCSKDEAAAIFSYLSSQEDIDLSPDLCWVRNRDYKIFRSHHFFDHMSPGTAQMLELISPGLVRKTLEIKTDK